MIATIKRLEVKLGFRKTKNFASASAQTAADYRCYYTGRLELPESYEGLKLGPGSKDGCTLDTRQFDVFFYPVEAVASGKTPVTGALAGDSMERFLMVVPHEDFHANKELRRLPATLNEAASTLIGFLTASEVARRRFGAEAEVSQNLSREPELFSQKAEIVNQYHADIGKLYAEAAGGRVSERDALAQKKKLFEELAGSCKAINPDPHSFNKCPAAINNAGLAFDATYTKYYPLIYQVYQAQGKDLRATVTAIKRALDAGSELDAVGNLRDLVRQAAAGTSAQPAIASGRRAPL